MITLRLVMLNVLVVVIRKAPQNVRKSESRLSRSIRIGLRPRLLG
jgi:hypothetical protein